MKSLSTYTYLLFLTILMLGGCKHIELEPSVITLLTDNSSKQWIVTELESDLLYPCHSDDIYVFKLHEYAWEDTISNEHGYEFKILDNYLSCEGDYLINEGHWTLNNQNDKITLFYEFGDYRVAELYNIKSISETELELSLQSEFNDDYGFQTKNTYIKLIRL